MEKDSKGFSVDYLKIVQILLILSVVFLAFHDKEGWGWLLFVLIITL